jgi:hypothetical protein
MSSKTNLKSRAKEYLSNKRNIQALQYVIDSFKVSDSRLNGNEIFLFFTKINQFFFQ